MSYAPFWARSLAATLSKLQNAKWPSEPGQSIADCSQVEQRKRKKYKRNVFEPLLKRVFEGSLTKQALTYLLLFFCSTSIHFGAQSHTGQAGAPWKARNNQCSPCHSQDSCCAHNHKLTLLQLLISRNIWSQSSTPTLEVAKSVQSTSKVPDSHHLAKAPLPAWWALDWAHPPISAQLGVHTGHGTRAQQAFHWLHEDIFAQHCNKTNVPATSALEMHCGRSAPTNSANLVLQKRKKKKETKLFHVAAP